MSINRHERLEVSTLPPYASAASHAFNEVLRDWESEKHKRKSHGAHHSHHNQKHSMEHREHNELIVITPLKEYSI
jgi:hypothetical protein